MKKMSSFLAAAMVLFFSSCNNSGKEKEEAKPDETPVTAKAPEAPVFSPYTAVTIQHTVKDFDKWLPDYKAHDSVRKSYSLTELAMGRGADNEIGRAHV